MWGNSPEVQGAVPSIDSDFSEEVWLAVTFSVRNTDCETIYNCLKDGAFSIPFSIQAFQSWVTIVAICDALDEFYAIIYSFQECKVFC